MMQPSSSSKLDRISSVYRFNLRRMRSVAIFYTVVLAVLGPVLFLLEYQRESLSYEGPQFFFTLAAAIMTLVLPFFQFAYLGSRQAMDLYQSLPVTRTKWYLGSFIGGMTVLWMPFVVLGGICLIFQPAMVWEFASVALTMLVLYSLLVFIIINCGTIFESILYTGIILVGYPVLLAELVVILGKFAMGWRENATTGIFGQLMRLSPAYNGLVELTFALGWSGDNTYYRFMQIVGPMLLVFAAAFLGGLYLYGKRKSESAGNSFAFRPLFYISALLISVTVGFGTYLILDYKSTGVLMGTLLGVITYFILDSIRNRGLRGIKETAVVSVGGLVAVGMFLGLAQVSGSFGYESYLPDVHAVSSVSVSWRLNGNQTYLEENIQLEEQENIELLRNFHQSVLKNLDALKGYGRDPATSLSLQEYQPYSFDNGQDPDQYGTCIVNLTYQLKNGQEVCRRYDEVPVALTQPLAEMAASAEYSRQQTQTVSALLGVLREYQMEELFDLSMDDQDHWVSYSITQEQVIRLLEAIETDIANRPAGWNVHMFGVEMEMSFSPTSGKDNQLLQEKLGRSYHTLTLYPSVDTGTLALLEQMNLDSTLLAGAGEETYVIVSDGEAAERIPIVEKGEVANEVQYPVMLLTTQDYEQAAKEEMHLEGFYFSGIYVDDGIDLTGLTRERQLYITRQQLQSLLDLTLDRGIADQRMPVLLVDNVSRLVPMENLQKVQEILTGIEAQ